MDPLPKNQCRFHNRREKEHLLPQLQRTSPTKRYLVGVFSNTFHNRVAGDCCGHQKLNALAHVPCEERLGTEIFHEPRIRTLDEKTKDPLETSFARIALDEPCRKPAVSSPCQITKLFRGAMQRSPNELTFPKTKTKTMCDFPYFFHVNRQEVPKHTALFISAHNSISMHFQALRGTNSGRQCSLQK
jgi:hypothetical protein